MQLKQQGHLCNWRCQLQFDYDLNQVPTYGSRLQIAYLQQECTLGVGRCSQLFLLRYSCKTVADVQQERGVRFRWFSVSLSACHQHSLRPHHQPARIDCTVCLTTSRLKSRHGALHAVLQRHPSLNAATCAPDSACLTFSTEDCQTSLLMAHARTERAPPA